MDIYNRIIEAIAEKLVSVRLDEVTWAQLQAAKKRMAAKKAGRAAGIESGHEYGHDRPASERPKVEKPSRQWWGQSGNKRGRFSPGGDLESPYGPGQSGNAPPVKPLRKDSDNLKGGKQGKPGVEW
jgi:hypothetical protein